MSQNTYIEQFCKIESNAIDLNGTIVFENKELDTNEFLKTAYKTLELSYPKFFKMDNLSKVTFLAADLILSESKNENTALVFSNYSSSLDTDYHYQESINSEENYYPSPAVFVYTLPNICIGEVSIKHQLKTENAFFVFEKYDVDFMMKYSNFLLESNKAEKVLCGWVEYCNDNYKVVLYLVSKENTNNSKEHNKEQLLNIFK